MRRFEYIEGTSAKFWEAEVSAASFVVVYGRIGAAGQRKEKTFPSADLAQKEMDRKVAEKLREGYQETTAPGSGGPAAPKRALPPRVKARKVSAASLARATDALVALEAELGARSWRVDLAARRAARSLDEVAGCDPLAHGPIAAVFDALMQAVTAPRGARRLPLRLALLMLLRLDVAAFTRALTAWRGLDDDAPAAPAVRALASLYDAVGDDELALRACALLGDRPEQGGLAEPVWQRRWRAVDGHLRARLTERGTTLAAVFDGVEGDPLLARRVQRMTS